jgi:hypothetical protein
LLSIKWLRKNQLKNPNFQNEITQKIKEMRFPQKNIKN